MHEAPNVIGIDIGSVAISVAVMSLQKDILATAYEFHQGEIEKTLHCILMNLNVRETCGISITSSTPPLVKSQAQYDTRVAIITAARSFYSKIGTILLVGGEKFGSLCFDKEDNYRSFKSNTSCAAGTGSFLDQQALRLNLSGIGELSDIAFRNRGAIPKIASRCAVFAKTDLIHAQQEGYTLEEICDGLCHGLAKNIVDTLFTGDRPLDPIIFIGGVSKNHAVVKHLNDIIGGELLVHEYSHLFGAVGSALNLLDEGQVSKTINLIPIDDIIISQTTTKKYFHEPLELRLSSYPDFDGIESYLFLFETKKFSAQVEVDIYTDLYPEVNYLAYLGIDIGSTSSKCVLMDQGMDVLAGFYTRTSGRPLEALQSILAAINDLIMRKQLEIVIIGAGTTGSGRKFVGKVIGADLIIDEITGHARAAYELNPKVDTIIEIGGQDSKFTTLKDGMVTTAVMNTVCAAGTGSFIEEQAIKLGCPLTDYANRTEHQRSPIASDRCTVFMERDINHYLNEGYSVDEALTAVLHAIRENYLTKVAVEGNIGQTVLFQGATAKNRALVAAFEQRLGKPIHVSRYCHLTGALGAALILADKPSKDTRFRGIEIYKKDIPLKHEVCDLCNNNCKITLAMIEGETVAYGFLCGREYNLKKYVNSNSSGFDLTKERKKAFEFKRPESYREQTVIGIPAALHLYEDLELWQHFFGDLGFETITTRGYRDAVKDGKGIAGAEFCAPMSALHGHVKYLQEKSDYIFLPFYLEKKSSEKGVRRHYCYYTQFASPLTTSVIKSNDQKRYLSPLINYLYNAFHTKAQLYRMLKSISSYPISFINVSAAYDRALTFKENGLKHLQGRFNEIIRDEEDIYVVLLGRPYNVLPGSMNKGIPNIFNSLGIKTFYQDMLSYERKDLRSIEPLLNELHWHYAVKILESTEIVSKLDAAYPVLLTSFKCSPDSFVIDYFKKLMESNGKPYLVLQLDDHDSSGGYETRIEAAVRSFRNHHSSFTTRIESKAASSSSGLTPVREKTLDGRTILIPNWDNLSLPLVVAALRGEGIDAKLLEEDQISIQQSLRYNTGQCIPLNIIIQEFVDYIDKNGLDPSRTVLWMASSWLACNVHLFPFHMRQLLETYGGGMEKAGIYVGPLSMKDLSIKIPPTIYFAYMFGGYLRKIGCKLRPYEDVKGKTDEAIAKGLCVLEKAFENKYSKESSLVEALAYFDGVKVTKDKRPKVAIFGDLYARDNNVINQDLIPFIEANNGELITTPYSDYMKMIAKPYLRKWLIEGHYLEALSSKVLITGLKVRESVYYRHFERFLDEPEPKYDDSPIDILSEYNLRIESTGESMDNILKIHYIMKHHPDISLFVQTSPAFCCPSLVTEAMARKIEEKTGVPIVSVTYDGTGGNKNEVIIPYLKYPRMGVEDNKCKTM